MTPNIQHPTTTTATPAAADAGFQRWNSPIPFLFGGVALVLGVVALALLILACSYKNPSSSSSSSSSSPEEEESSHRKAEKAARALQAEMEPRIVVIMAGETNPTHLAKPTAAVRPPPPPHQQV